MRDCANVRGMRWFSALLLSAAFTFSAAAADVELVRVWPQWRSAESFERIGEFFGLGDATLREPVIRTQPKDRSGLYFLVRVKTDTPLESARFVIDIVRPDALDAKSYTFPVSVPRKSTVFHLGLSGEDWPGGKDAHPVAWRLSLVDAGGREVAADQSFLWAKPVQ